MNPSLERCHKFSMTSHISAYDIINTQVKCGMIALPFDLEDRDGGGVQQQLSAAAAEAAEKGSPVKVR